jgi:hypothetical protein
MLFRLMGLDVLGGGDNCAQYDQAENNQQNNKRRSKSHRGSRSLPPRAPPQARKYPLCFSISNARGFPQAVP